MNNFSKLAVMFAMTAAIGSIVAQGLPTWVTETGYPTDGTVTARQQG